MKLPGITKKRRKIIKFKILWLNVYKIAVTEANILYSGIEERVDVAGNIVSFKLPSFPSRLNFLKNFLKKLLNFFRSFFFGTF